MSRPEKTLEKVLTGRSDANVSFTDICVLLRSLGFAERVRGSHHIFTMDGIAEILNMQPKAGKAKPYQVRQVRNVILDNQLASEPDEPTSERDEAEADESSGAEDAE